MRERILNDLTQALKQGNKEVLTVLRMVKGSIQLEEIKTKHELTDDEIITIVSREIKTRKEAVAEFVKGNRDDLVTKTNSEIDILKQYLPKQLEPQEVQAIIDEAIETIQPQGPRDMGKIMSTISPKLSGRTDMTIVSKIVKDRLSKIM